MADLVSIGTLETVHQVAQKQRESRGLVPPTERRSGPSLKWAAPASPSPLSMLRGVLDNGENLPQLRMVELQLAAAGETSLAESTALSERFEASVDRLVASAQGRILAANQRVMDTHRFASVLLLAVALVAVAFAVLVFWLYVKRSVIARLAGLSTSMRTIAAGDLEAPIPRGGDDEIGRMSEPLPCSATLSPRSGGRICANPRDAPAARRCDREDFRGLRALRLRRGSGRVEPALS